MGKRKIEHEHHRRRCWIFLAADHPMTCQKTDTTQVCLGLILFGVYHQKERGEFWPVSMSRDSSIRGYLLPSVAGQVGRKAHQTIVGFDRGFLDSGVAAAETSSTAAAGLVLNRREWGRDQDEAALQQAIEASKQDMDRQQSRRNEEDIVLEYIKKQGLPEEEYREKMMNKGKENECPVVH
ncbi:hypothetical protein E4U41_000924 [Claviceps citrina]|nr:hypothetical protein E4U41_000924 [Claviceps citrina]